MRVTFRGGNRHILATGVISLRQRERGLHTDAPEIVLRVKKAGVVRSAEGLFGGIRMPMPNTTRHLRGMRVRPMDRIRLRYPSDGLILELEFNS
jgi:hypothetical protein